MILIGDLLKSSRNGMLYRKFSSLEEVFKEKWTKTRDAFGVVVPSKRMCGVEIEVERIEQAGNLTLDENVKLEQKYKDRCGINLSMLFESLWRQETDGSLRNNGREYITRLGTSFADASVSVPLLISYLELFEPNAQANARTGLHVHVDVRDWKLKDLQRLIMIYLVFEQALFNYSGARQGSLFCVPLADTNFPIDDLPAIHETHELESVLRNQAKKYMGFNLLPLISQGTVEFRMHRGTLKAKEINRWLYIISSMFDAAEKFDDNEELKSILLNIRRANLVSDFAKTVFGEAYPFLEPHITPEGIKYGVDKVKEMCVDAKAIPEQYILPEKKKYKAMAVNNRDIDFAEILRAGRDAAPRFRPIPVGFDDDDDWRADFEARLNPDLIRGRHHDRWLPTEARELPPHEREEISSLRREHHEMHRDYWIGRDGSPLPGGEVVRQDRFIVPRTNYYVHKESTLGIWNKLMGIYMEIRADLFDVDRDIFLFVISHRRVV